MMGPVIILQNYFTPYRHDLFESLGRQMDLTVVYSQRPADGGRRWEDIPPQNYRAIQAPSYRLGSFVFFALPRTTLRSAADPTVILHDDNPANLSMLVLAALLRLRGLRTALWVEHVPTETRGLKLRYQRFCSVALIVLCRRVIAFSEHSEQYVRRLSATVAVSRMLQSVPTPAQQPQARAGLVRRFGFLGSNDSRKNLEGLVEAFSQLEGDVELHIAGGAQHEHDDTRIHYWGYVEGQDRERLFGSIDVLVLPSLHEPWGLVVNEALARGAGAMVSSACGSSELVRLIDPLLIFQPTVPAMVAALQHARTLDIAALQPAIAAAASAYSTDVASARMIDLLCKDFNPGSKSSAPGSADHQTEQ